MMIIDWGTMRMKIGIDLHLTSSSLNTKKTERRRCDIITTYYCLNASLKFEMEWVGTNTSSYGRGGPS